MSVEAIVLAGGRGTRMGTLGDQTPKPMLPIAGRPLIARHLDRLAAVGVRHVVLATGWRAEAFAALDRTSLGVHLTVVTEEAPLGTGGALRFAATALRGAPETPVLVLNGDLVSGHDLRAQVAALPEDAEVCLHVREIPDPRPYGVVEVEGSRVTAFIEKPEHPRSRLVNAGTYLLRPRALGRFDGIPCSWERDLLPPLVAAGHVVAHRAQAYFLDVGTPEALAQAESDAAAGLI